MAHKLLIPIQDDDVAPRFDLATEVLIIQIDDQGTVTRERTMVMPQSSAEDLCTLILTVGADTVICNGIEDEYYRYLTWKKVDVHDSVMERYRDAVDNFILKQNKTK
jgi:predicted Fe-Mo cluster-binding NifX family protein